MTSVAANRLARLRQLLVQFKIDAYIVPTADAHQSEYVPEFAMRRAYLSGFTGSAGTAVVTQNEARLWTDGRYFLQATQQLSPEWTLMRDRLPETPSIEQWLVEQFASRHSLEQPLVKVGIDPTLFSASECKAIESLWAGAKSKITAQPYLSLVNVAENLVDKIWSEQPAVPSRAAFVLGAEFAGVDVTTKLAQVRAQLVEKKCDALLVAALDEVAWLFNVRGADIEFNPVVIAYAIVAVDSATLFVNAAKIDDVVRAHLAAANVSIAPYERFFEAVRALDAAQRRVWFDAATTSRAAATLVHESRAHVASSPLPLAKAIKNSVELEGTRRAHIRDAAALCSFLSWLDAQAASGAALPDECGASDWLELARRRQEHYVSLSFDTISGSGPNGAIIHYKAERATARQLTRSMYLVDSGAQYFDGTTDVTRTVHLGEPTAHERRCYTRVLQGHIDLALARFPHGVTGGALDILARMPLYNEGLDYRHGTGHGVGAFLNVHEGPHGISFRPGSRLQALLPGMLVTNEPGYYEDGAFGIRIENVMSVVAASTPHRFGGLAYYEFEQLTLAPYARNLTDLSLLTEPQRRFVDAYHAQVRERVGPLLKQQDAVAYDWLVKQTAPWQ